MEDAQIVELFFARSEDAISELDQKYGKLYHKLADNILKSAQDAEECVNDAYLSTWNAIPPQRPESLSAFVGTLVRRCSITRYRANTAMKRNSHYDVCMEEIEEFLASPGARRSTARQRSLPPSSNASSTRRARRTACSSCAATGTLTATPTSAAFSVSPRATQDCG